MTVSIQEIREHCTELENQYSNRNRMFDEVERMFLMEWTQDRPQPDVEAKWTISPQARDAALGAIRLMIAADPIFSVPYDKSSMQTRQVAEKLEKAASAIWYMAGRIRQTPVHYDAVASAVLFGEMHIGAISTRDLLDHARGGSKAAVRRVERIAAMTPFLFEVYDPRTGYPEFDNLGLASYFRKVKMRAGEVLDRWGRQAIKAGLDPDARYDEIEYCDYWDNEVHAVWVEGKGEPLFLGSHNLPEIPIAAQIVEGSNLHGKPEYDRQPLLYGLWKSGLWNRQNLSLTVMYTNMFALGANPVFMFRAGGAERELEVRYDVPGGYIKILPGEDYGPLAKQIIDPSLQLGYQIATDLSEEATLFKQALGQPLAGGKAPFSSVALLSQAGRLPLISAQRRGSWGIGRAMELAFALGKQQGGIDVKNPESQLSVQAEEIPDSLMFEVRLEVSLPTDDRQDAMIAMQLAGGENPLASRRYVLENILHVNQPGEMEKEIFTERAERMMAELQLQRHMQSMMAAGQQPPQQQTVPGAGPVPAPPGEMSGPAPMMSEPGIAGPGLPAMPLSGPVAGPGELPPEEQMGGVPGGYPGY